MTVGLVLAALGGSTAPLRLALTIGSALLCYHLAARKGRNRLVWAAAGFFTVLAVIVIALLPRARGRGPNDFISVSIKPSLQRSCRTTSERCVPDRYGRRDG